MKVIASRFPAYLQEYVQEQSTFQLGIYYVCTYPSAVLLEERSSQRTSILAVRSRFVARHLWGYWVDTTSEDNIFNELGISRAALYKQWQLDGDVHGRHGPWRPRPEIERHLLARMRSQYPDRPRLTIRNNSLVAQP